MIFDLDTALVTIGLVLVIIAAFINFNDDDPDGYA